MIKKLWWFIGTSVFWLLWPVWYIYFRSKGTRSRVLIVVDKEVLLIRNWLNVNDLSLPGGDVKKHESIRASAVRELREEVGISVPESSLVRIGATTKTKYGIRTRAVCYYADLTEKPVLKCQKIEIAEAIWVPFGEAGQYKLGYDALYAIKRYHPSEQGSLL